MSVATLPQGAGLGTPPATESRGFLGLADAYERTGNTAPAAEARQRAATLERSP
jgi:hypothetical protein